MKYQAVYIEWIDSALKLPVWLNTEKLLEETIKPHDKYQTIAYLVGGNDLEYALAASIHFDDGEAVQFGNVFTIPKGCVTKLKNIKI